MTANVLLLFCGLKKEISLIFLYHVVYVIINKSSFESFMCLDDYDDLKDKEWTVLHAVG